MHQLALFLIALVFVASGGLLLVAVQWPLKDFPTEIAKSLLQLVVIAVAGHVVSILITKANNERQDLLRADELRNSLLQRLNEAFVEVKKVRRLARATAEKLVMADRVYLFIPRQKFHEFLQALNDAQLGLELVSKDVESNKALFVDAEQVIGRLDAMEEYLNGLVDEYEHSSARPVADPPDCYAVSAFPSLGDFLGSYRPSQFRTAFVHTYYANLASIRGAFSGGRTIALR